MDKRVQVQEILDMLDGIRPNAYTTKEKLHFLNTIEGRVYREVLENKEGMEGEFRPFLEGEEERELAVPMPYSDLYLYYLAAMIDVHNGDVGRYNDTVVLFTMAWDEFVAWHLQNHKPKQVNLTGMIPEGRRR